MQFLYITVLNIIWFDWTPWSILLLRTLCIGMCDLKILRKISASIFNYNSFFFASLLWPLFSSIHVFDRYDKETHKGTEQPKFYVDSYKLSRVLQHLLNTLDLANSYTLFILNPKRPVEQYHVYGYRYSTNTCPCAQQGSTMKMLITSNLKTIGLAFLTRNCSCCTWYVPTFQKCVK